MSGFYYLIEKLQQAEFLSEPFEHLEIKDFLSKEHFNEIVKDSQIHFEPQETHEQLRHTLHSNSYKPVAFPGCTTNEDDYYTALNNSTWDDMKTGQKGSNTEGVGIAYNLTKIKNPMIGELIKFLNSPVFQHAMMDRFDIVDSTRIVTRIHKYVTGYEISPHPDTRAKALTYLLNINRDETSESLDIHTGLLKFKDEYKFINEYWNDNPHLTRSWVKWDWCNIEKTVSKNNSIVLFKPSNYSLHSVKLDYDHLPQQRTQIYGNLMFTGKGGGTPGAQIRDFEKLKLQSKK